MDIVWNRGGIAGRRRGTAPPSRNQQSSRWSLPGHYGVTGEDWQPAANTYAIHSTQVLWNDFIHFLFDPATRRRRQRSRGNLIQQGREQMMIALIDDRYANRRASQTMCNVKATEAAPTMTT